MKTFKIILYFIIALAAIPFTVDAQQSIDSLSLQNILKQVIDKHPAILKMEQEMNAADARIGMAKSGYLPDISFNSSFTRIGPVSSISLGQGEFDLFPANNYTASVNYSQNIFDFGRTSKAIAFENQSKELVNLSVDQLKQKLTMAVVNTYYYIVYLQEAINIKDEQLNTLNEHLHFIEKKKETGSATPYEILTTKVRISTIENQKTDLLTALRVQKCQMNSLLGQAENTAIVVKKELQNIQASKPTEMLLASANSMRQELKMAQQKTYLSELHYNVIKVQNNPELKFYASGGVKNGYIPDLNKGLMNYTAGIGFRIPLYDANKNKYSLLQVKSSIESNKLDVDLAKRNITNEVVESQANSEASIKKISQSELQYEQAQKAYNLAQISFKSGIITNIELLDNATALSEAGLSVLKAKIDYSLNLLKLKIALGEKLY